MFIQICDEKGKVRNLLVLLIRSHSGKLGDGLKIQSPRDLSSRGGANIMDVIYVVDVSAGLMLNLHLFVPGSEWIHADDDESRWRSFLRFQNSRAILGLPSGKNKDGGY